MASMRKQGGESEVRWPSPIFTFEDGDAPPDDDIVRDVLHDGRGLAGHQREEYRRLVKVPEEEQLAARRRRRAHVTEEIRGGIPEDAVEAEDNLIVKRV